MQDGVHPYWDTLFWVSPSGSRSRSSPWYFISSVFLFVGLACLSFFPWLILTDISKWNRATSTSTVGLILSLAICLFIICLY